MEPWGSLALDAADALDLASSAIGRGTSEQDDEATDRVLIKIRRFRAAAHPASEHRDRAAVALTAGVRACELLTYASRVGAIMETTGPSPSAAAAIIGRRCLDAARHAVREAIAGESAGSAFETLQRLSGRSFDEALARMKHLDSLAREHGR